MVVGIAYPAAKLNDNAIVPALVIGEPLTDADNPVGTVALKPTDVTEPLPGPLSGNNVTRDWFTLMQEL